MAWENQVNDRTLELYNGLLSLKHNYDGWFGSYRYNTASIPADFQPHPLGQIGFYFGRTSSDVDNTGLNLYHWSTTPANASHAIYEFINSVDQNGQNIVIPNIIGYGEGMPPVIGDDTRIQFYEEDTFVDDVRAPDGYFLIDGDQYPGWYAVDGSNPGVLYSSPFTGMYDFYGTQKSYKKIGDTIYRLVGESYRAGIKWSRLPESQEVATYGIVTLYWVPEYKHIPFSEIMFTKSYYRLPRSNSAFWDSETNGFISPTTDAAQINYPPSVVPYRGDFLSVNPLTIDFGRNTGHRSNNTGKYVYASPYNIQGTYIPMSLVGDLYFDRDYITKEVDLSEQGRVKIKSYRVTGYKAYGYGEVTNYVELDSGEVFDLFPRRENGGELYIQELPFNLTVSGSVIRNKTDYMTNGMLDLDKVFNSGGPFMVDGKFVNIRDRNTLNFCSNINFYYYMPGDANNQFIENIYFLNDQKDTPEDLITGDTSVYDFDVSIETSSVTGIDYYSDNLDIFDGGTFGTFGAPEGSGTRNINNDNQFNGGSVKKFLYFNGSGTLNTIKVDTYQTGRDFVTAIDADFNERWRTNHLSPTFSLPYLNSGAIERPGDSFQTIMCGVADNERLFIGGNTVRVLPRLTVENPEEYQTTVSKYNEKIQNCI